MPSFDGGLFRLRGTCIKSIKLSGGRNCRNEK